MLHPYNGYAGLGWLKGGPWSPSTASLPVVQGSSPTPSCDPPALWLGVGLWSREPTNHGALFERCTMANWWKLVPFLALLNLGPCLGGCLADGRDGASLTGRHEAVTIFQDGQKKFYSGKDVTLKAKKLQLGDISAEDVDLTAVASIPIEADAKWQDAARAVLLRQQDRIEQRDAAQAQLVSDLIGAVRAAIPLLIPSGGVPLPTGGGVAVPTTTAPAAGGGAAIDVALSQLEKSGLIPPSLSAIVEKVRNKQPLTADDIQTILAAFPKGK